ncbi:MAG TPA: L,D-transpeptidase family protein [Candidatus Limnocylindrales bacterium]|nr:L,D-transpeptidase family protein [Candidatus Limnocylindrales bacterium]
MRRAAAACFAVFLASAMWPKQTARTFLDDQLTHARVKAAAQEKDAGWRELFQKKKLHFPPRQIFLQVFKREAVLEVWASDGAAQSYVLMKSFRICASSGQPGPKRRYGDGQVPEGFYEIDQFNPGSTFYLSLRVSYPNRSDRVLGSHTNPGGDIYVHGNCVTIGCIPITDDGIKEVYWLAALARQPGEKRIPIWIFPSRLTNDGYRALAEEHRGESELVAFWGNLKEGFDLFNKEHRIPEICVSPEGRYLFHPAQR